MTQTLAIVVTTPPNSNKTVTAINIAKTAVSDGYKITGVFFYQQGALNASTLVQIPNDEFQVIKGWEDLKINHNVSLHLCITAAEKNGLSDGQDIEINNINPHFTISGLGELVELSAVSDRIIQL